mgnify:CR=1 FL=1
MSINYNNCFPGLTQDDQTCWRFTDKDNQQYERTLFDNWWREIINQFGIKTTYYVNTFNLLSADNIYGEEPTKTFAPPIEFVMGVNLNENAINLSQFGFLSDDEVTGFIHYQSFQSSFSAQLSSVWESQFNIIEPKAGDVFQLSEYGDDRPYNRQAKYFEITEKLDEDIAQINPLAGHYVFLVKAKRYDYSFEPGIPFTGGALVNSKIYIDTGPYFQDTTQTVLTGQRYYQTRYDGVTAYGVARVFSEGYSNVLIDQETVDINKFAPYRKKLPYMQLQYLSSSDGKNTPFQATTAIDSFEIIRKPDGGLNPLNGTYKLTQTGGALQWIQQGVGSSTRQIFTKGGGTNIGTSSASQPWTVQIGDGTIPYDSSSEDTSPYPFQATWTGSIWNYEPSNAADSLEFKPTGAIVGELSSQIWTSNFVTQISGNQQIYEDSFAGRLSGFTNPQTDPKKDVYDEYNVDDFSKEDVFDMSRNDTDVYGDYY